MRFALMMASLAVLGGCSSLIVTNDDLVRRTAFTLGLEPTDFSITGREDDGTATTYKVVTKSGARHSCYVASAVTITGKVVSDAVCNKQGEKAKHSLSR